MINRGAIFTDENLLYQELYREVFTTQSGRMVFAHLMGYLGYFEPVRPGNESDGAMRNVALWILETMGICHEENLLKLTNSLLAADIDTRRRILPWREARRRRKNQIALTDRLLAVSSYRPNQKEATNHG